MFLPENVKNSLFNRLACFKLLFGKIQFALLNLQVTNEEDDVKSHFYKDLTQLSDNDQQSSSSAHDSRKGFSIPILFSRKKRVQVTSSSSFKKAIKASQEKVIECCLQFLPFLEFPPACFGELSYQRSLSIIKALALHFTKPLE